MYKAGESTLCAKVASTLSIVNSKSSPELNSGELMRYLTEAVWYPPAFLPAQGIEWVPIDDNSAMASLEDKWNKVSLVFYFNNHDDVERIFADERPREVDGNYVPTPWTGYFKNYQLRNGILVPLEGEAEWNLPSGDLPYWRGYLDEIEYSMSN